MSHLVSHGLGDASQFSFFGRQNVFRKLLEVVKLEFPVVGDGDFPRSVLLPKAVGATLFSPGTPYGVRSTTAIRYAKGRRTPACAAQTNQK